MFDFETTLIELFAPGVKLRKVQEYVKENRLFNYIKTIEPKSINHAKWSLTIKIDDYVSLPKHLQL